MRKGEIEKARREAQDCPVAWFVMLEQARKTNDFEGAASAIRELKRLGVTVKYDREQRGARHE